MAGCHAPRLAETFVPVTLVNAVAEPAQAIELELQRGAVNVRVRWPAGVASACAAWVREILR